MYDMKRCTLCGENKEITEFNKNKHRKDGLQSFCRECQHKRFKNYYHGNVEHHRSVVKVNSRMRIATLREYVVEYLTTHPCVDCGLTDIRVLEFDHLPEFEKINEVSKLICGGYSLNKVKTEIAKCEVRCRNCHTIKTYERLGRTWHDNFIELMGS